MLNSAPEDITPDPGDPDEHLAPCWLAVHQEFLERGIVTDTCAEYYFGPGGTSFGLSGFRMKFVPCDEHFTSGGY